MKKLSLIVAIALIISVGGVYATWNYAETKMDNVEHNFKNLGITDVNTNIKTGSVAVTDTLILKIDDNNATLTPAWDADVTDSNGGNITMVFTPNQGASTTQFRYTVTLANNTYESQPIFTTDTITAAHTTAEEILSDTFTFTAGQASATATITLSDITDVLSVKAIQLPTITDYNNYRTALNGVQLVLTIEEVTTP